jgi:hypothetical protein
MGQGLRIYPEGVHLTWPLMLHGSSCWDDGCNGHLAKGRSKKRDRQWRKGVRTSNDGSGEPVASIETDTIATSGPVHLNLASVRLEALGWVLGLRGMSIQCHIDATR